MGKDMTSKLKIGDTVELIEDVYVKAFDMTIRAGELGQVTDIDPDDLNALLVRLIRRFDWLGPWRNNIPVAAAGVAPAELLHTVITWRGFSERAA
jgi:hypothetical protein